MEATLDLPGIFGERIKMVILAANLTLKASLATLKYHQGRRTLSRTEDFNTCRWNSKVVIISMSIFGKDVKPYPLQFPSRMERAGQENP